MPPSNNRRWNSEVVRLFWKRVGGASPFKAAERVCFELLTKLGKNSPPFQSDKYEYAKVLGIRVVENQIPCDGILTLAGDTFVIQVRVDVTAQRRSFTVCHELGHIEMLRRAATYSYDIRSLLRRPQRLSEEEHLSDFFAANLLMPRDHFLPKAKSLKPSLSSLEQLAADYNTSLEATALRILTLDAWKCHFFWCLPEVQSDQKTNVRIIQHIKSRFLRCPYARPKRIDWGVSCIRSAFEERNPVLGKTARLKFQAHSLAMPEYWLLEARTYPSQNRANVLALVRPEPI
jgi:Zn-dependent peptidase ImmA (M78 family)